MALHIEDGDTFVEGRSPKKAKELLDKAKAAGESSSAVRTTTFGYIVPKSILDGEAKADADDGGDDNLADAGPDSTDDSETQIEEQNTEGDTAQGDEADATGDGDEQYDPADHNADEVIEYLDTASAEERERVLAAEKDGKARKSVLSSTEGDK